MTISGGGTTSSGGDASTVDTTPCDPNTDVAALNACRRFGDWALDPMMPHLMLEAGVVVRRLPSTLGMHGVVGGRAYRSRLTSARSSDYAIDSVFRMTVELHHDIYGGVEGELGGLSSAPGALEVDGATSSYTQDVGILYGGAVVVGVRKGLGPAVLSTELAVGGRGVVHAFSTRVDGEYHSFDLDSAQLVIEPRVRAELWLSPYMTAGATIGANTVERGDWSAGLFIGLHTRAFGGH